MPTSHFTLSGLTCEACVKLISKRLSKIHDIQSVSVEQSGHTMLTAEREIGKSEVEAVLTGTQYKVE